MQRFSHTTSGTGIWELTAEDLSIVATKKLPAHIADSGQVSRPGRIVHVIPDTLMPEAYVRWETYPAKRDVAQKETSDTSSELSLSITLPE